MTNKALIVGGGIAGMQAALDLADQGYKVYIVEKTPSVGGRMAQLDKTFPTNDCATCTLAPRMVEVGRHPNIDILVNSEVKAIEGKAWDFKVKILKHRSYVDPSSCTGCGICMQVCPVKVPSEFNMAMGPRKAIYIPFPQAVPNVAFRDERHCLYLTKGKCGVCVKKCPANAIKNEDEDEEIELNVGAVLLTTGFDEFNPSVREEYGFGRFKNVITALQMERLLAASGPTGGHILKPSDNKEPKRIAWIQCVGSRDVRFYKYCSRACCMFATKEAIIAEDHCPGLERYIFYMDVRAYGKGFEEYYNRAKELGVNYVRGRVSRIIEDPKTKNLILKYEDTKEGEQKELEADMVVLSSALIAPKSNKDTAETFGIELDEYGFFKPKDSYLAPMETSREGIFIGGVALSPRDIPDSISLASGAAAKMVSILGKPPKMAGKKIKERDVKGQEPRIGVFICKCGINIAGVVDVEGVAEYAKMLPNVVYATHNLFTCSSDAQKLIKKAIEEHNLNRIVVMACTPRTHDPLFKKTVEEAGLNPYLFTMGSIREHVSWVHSNKPETATKKAKDMTRMMIAKVRLLEPQYATKLPVNKSALVIGGGIAGMTSAVDIANSGFKVYLVEKEKELGGLLNKIYKIGQRNASELLKLKIEEVKKNRNIKVITRAEVKDLGGYAGNFEVKISQNGKEIDITVGVIIVATGGEVLKPKGLYGYGEYKDVITMLELEEALKKGEIRKGTYVMILCAGARTKERPYCSRICCTSAIKNAIEIKRLSPESDVLILNRDIRTFGQDEEELYKSALEDYDVKFFRFSADSAPNVREENGKLIVDVHTLLLGERIEIEADEVVLSTPIVPSQGSQELSQMLKVPVDSNGFFLEAHLKLRPHDFSNDGMYLCGCAHSPKGAQDSIAQASGAASRALVMLGKGEIVSEATAVYVIPELCIGCGRCEATCEFGAVKIEEVEKGVFKAQVNEGICKGCGNCTSECPTGALRQKQFTTEMILSMIRTIKEEA